MRLGPALRENKARLEKNSPRHKLWKKSRNPCDEWVFPLPEAMGEKCPEAVAGWLLGPVASLGWASVSSSVKWIQRQNPSHSLGCCEDETDVVTREPWECIPQSPGTGWTEHRGVGLGC